LINNDFKSSIIKFFYGNVYIWTCYLIVGKQSKCLTNLILKLHAFIGVISL
jgi:hypothetical protein